MKFFKLLVKNNTGVSAKNFFLVTVTIIGCVLLICPCIVLLVEIFSNKTIQTDLHGLAAYIGAVAGIFTSAGLTKAWSEKFEKGSSIKEEKKDEDKDENCIEENES